MEDESEDKKTPSETWDLNNDGKYVDCVDEVDGDGEQTEVCEYVFPWGGDPMMQFKEYYTFGDLRDRMMRIAADNPNIIQFHEGLNGGINARGDETTADTYEG